MPYIAKHTVIAKDTKGNVVSFAPGEEVKGVPADQIPYLIERGAIVEADKKLTAKEPVAVSTEPTAPVSTVADPKGDPKGDGLDD